MSSLKSTIPISILSGWKEIANHLGKGVRTVQRYELELSLPIRRPTGKRRGSVIATAAELDAWVSASPLSHSAPLHQTLTESFVAGFNDFKQSIADQRRLREELRELRQELHTSLELLRVTVRAVPDESTGERSSSGSVIPFETGRRRVN